MPRKKDIRPVYFSASKKYKNTSNTNTFLISQPVYDDTNLQEFEQDWRSTLAGTALDKKIEFVMGRGIKPVFELIDEGVLTEEQISEKLKVYDGLKQKITDYEKLPNIKFQARIRAGATNAKVFGRCVIAFDGMDNVSGIGDENKLPTAIKILHPRDLGRVELSDDGWNVNGVYLGLGDRQIIPKEEMIYIINHDENPVKHNQGYGYSEMERINGSAKALRRLIEFDAPEIAESMWASYGTFLVDTTGLTESQATQRITTLLNSLKAGAFNGISAKKDEITFLPTQLKAEVEQIVSLINVYERLIVGNFGVPGPLLGREEDSNMATLFAKIRLFMAGPVQSDRDWLGEIVAEQWYKKLVTVFEPEALNTIRVKAEFEPIIIEEWTDIVDALQKLKNALPNFPDNGLLELAGLEKYQDDLQVANDEAKLRKDQSQEFMSSAKDYLNKINPKQNQNPQQVNTS